jgi:ABC-type cobalamin/Fe3+-siderophores transport system ATPase subunit
MSTGSVQTHVVSAYQVTTRGGNVYYPPAFEIDYVPRGGQPVFVWKSDAGFSLTVFRSPSGTGKTTFIQRIYSILMRSGFPAPTAKKSLFAPMKDLYSTIKSHWFPPPAKPTLSFDFAPNLDTDVRISVAYVPQHAPTVRHWVVRDLLPASPTFLSCFFADRSEELLPRRLNEFSGGQRLKIYACSALEKLRVEAGDTSFLFLDETFDGLGADEAGRCIAAFKDQWHSLVGTQLHVLLVSHLNHSELLHHTNIQTVSIGLSGISNTEHKQVVEVFNI